MSPGVESHNPRAPKSARGAGQAATGETVKSGQPYDQPPQRPSAQRSSSCLRFSSTAYGPCRTSDARSVPARPPLRNLVLRRSPPGCRGGSVLEGECGETSIQPSESSPGTHNDIGGNHGVQDALTHLVQNIQELLGTGQHCHELYVRPDCSGMYSTGMTFPGSPPSRQSRRR